MHFYIQTDTYFSDVLQKCEVTNMFSIHTLCNIMQIANSNLFSLLI